jgi:hypothetical protein
VFVTVYAVTAVFNLVEFVCYEHTADKLMLALVFGVLIVYQLAFDKLESILDGFKEIAEGYAETCGQLHEVIREYRRMLHEQL